MAHLLIVVLEDLTKLHDLLQAWHEIGIPGATILESIGAHRARSWLSWVGLGGLERLFEAKEVRRRTLFAALDDEELMERAVAEAENVVGGFDRPYSGMLLVLPVTLSKGLNRPVQTTSVQILPPAIRPGWDVLRSTPIEQADIILHLEPTIVRPDTPLDEVAQAMLAHPNTHVACVVAEDGRLTGLIKLRALADDLFFHILPEEFLSEVTDLEHMLAYANKSRMRTAADAMSKPVWVKRGETVKDAFKRMHENDLPGMPVVDERYRVVGYIDLLELLAVCLKIRRETPISEESE